MQEPMVDYSEAEDGADEFEIVEVFWVHARGQVDLKRVVVVLEQAVTRIEHLVQEEEEPLVGDAAILWLSASSPSNPTMNRLLRSSGQRRVIAAKLSSKTRPRCTRTSHLASA